MKQNITLIYWLIILILSMLVIDFYKISVNNRFAIFFYEAYGNIGGTTIAALFFIIISKQHKFKQKINITFSAAIGLIIYEFIQKFLPWQTFDMNDILGTLVGIFLTILIILLDHLLIQFLFRRS